MKTYDEMIKYFKGVQAQHEAFTQLGYKNTSGDTKSIIKTYNFVIEKLEEWKKESQKGK